jgi:hypothetical protein
MTYQESPHHMPALILGFAHPEPLEIILFLIKILNLMYSVIATQNKGTDFFKARFRRVHGIHCFYKAQK